MGRSNPGIAADARPLVGQDADARWDWATATAVCLAATRRVLGPGPAAEDAAQEALLHAWRGRASCRDAGNPAPWLRRIAYHEALRAARRREHPGLLDEQAFPGPAPLDELTDRLGVRHLLQRLDPIDRRLIIMQYWADVPLDRIADATGMPVGTVKVRLHRARATLRSMLEDLS